MLLEEFWHGKYRANTHFVGFTTGHGHAAIGSKRLQTQLRGEFRLHHHLRGRAIRQLGRVTRGNSSTLNDGLKSLHALQRGRSDPFICRHRNLGFRGLTSLFVPHDPCGGDRNDFIGILSSLISRSNTLLGLKSIFIHDIPGDVIALGHYLRGLQHWHVDILVHRDQLFVDDTMHVHVFILNEGNRFHPASNNDIHAIVQDLLRRRRHSHQPR